MAASRREQPPANRFVARGLGALERRAGEQEQRIERKNEIPPGRLFVMNGGFGGCKLIFKVLHRERLAYFASFVFHRAGAK